MVNWKMSYLLDMLILHGYVKLHEGTSQLARQTQFNKSNPGTMSQY